MGFVCSRNDCCFLCNSDYGLLGNSLSKTYSSHWKSIKVAAKIKLQRCGSKSKPFFRVVIQDESKSPSGKVVAIIGQYAPLAEPTQFTVDKEVALAWIKKGAKPTDKVRILLGKAGILPLVDLLSRSKRKPKSEAPAEEKKVEAKKEEKPAEVAPPAEAQQ